jgi:hypothetical protein
MLGLTGSGAVLHAKDCTVIKTRRSPMMYGIRCRHALRYGETAADCYYGPDGVLYTTSGFYKYVDLNQELDVDSEIMHVFSPGNATLDWTDFEIYGTDQPTSHNPSLITGMKRIAAVKVSGLLAGLSTVRDYTHYKIIAAIRFGDACLTVTVKDTITGKQIATTVSYN